MNWLKSHPKGSILSVYVQPGASKDEVSGIHGDRIKIKIRARPENGEANEGLINYLSEILEVPKMKVHLIRGETSRQKDLLIECSENDLKDLFQKRFKLF